MVAVVWEQGLSGAKLHLWPQLASQTQGAIHSKTTPHSSSLTKYSVDPKVC